jgi:CheY-like chemotaxis protein
MNQESPRKNTEYSGVSNASALIFLAEDDMDDQELLIDAMSQYDGNLTFQTVTNGKQAIVLLGSLPHNSLPSLIILDYNLPELNGAQILEMLNHQERFQPIPKVVWSTSNSELYKNRCLALGAKAYFVKPSDLTGIQNLAKEMLAFRYK